MSSRLDRTRLGKKRRDSCEHGVVSILVPGGKILSRSGGKVEASRMGRDEDISIHLYGNVSQSSSAYKKEAVIPPFEQYPFLAKKLHSGIFLRLYSCKNSQLSPFLHKPRSQCLHTKLLKFELLFAEVCLSGHLGPKGQ